MMEYCFWLDQVLYLLISLQVAYMIGTGLLEKSFTRYIRKNVSFNTREKWARVAVRALGVIFPYFRLTRMLILLTLDFIGRKLSISARRVRRNFVTQKLGSWINKSSISKWSEQVPEDIMQSILQRLSISDYVRCKAVCHSWRASVDMAIATKNCPPARQHPLLMIGSHPSCFRDPYFASLSLAPKITLKRAIPNYIPAIYKNMMNRLACVGSIEGWMVMVDSILWRPESNNFAKSCSLYLHNRGRQSTLDIILFFLNPISGARVMLPSSQSSTLFPCGCNNGSSFPIVKVVASATPTSQHCFVASLCSVGHLALCRPTDKSWTLIHEGINFCDIEFMDGKLYAATDNGLKFLTVFDIIQDPNANGPISYGAQRLDMRIPFLRYNIWRMGDVLRVSDYEVMHLATDATSMDLFLIFRRINFDFKADQAFPLFEIKRHSYINPPKTKGFRVFKLEHDSDDRPQWVQVVDLGDRILFLSETANIFIPNHDDKTLDRNCIYFAFNYSCLASLSSHSNDRGVFFMTNRSLGHFRLSSYGFLTLFHTRPVWFTPSLW
ncbi:unnamed protein product [Prunus armeniaca]|uniref:F-box domain-containing protein n=1 Tax=Prunus armeniaca TaxID=36596 RepID=A0A6J5WX52_PRUAR|nr:unnamed protein product [Prunus armeniaca]